MTPGTLIHDIEFRFRDGEKGKKLIAILNDGEDGYYLFVKMTSNPAFKSTQYGCHPNDRYPNFFCPVGTCCLKENTWIQLDQFFEADTAEMLSKHFAGKMNRIGILPDKILRELLDCALASDDITPTQVTIVENTLRSLSEMPAPPTHN